MQIEHHRWCSPRLNRDMELKVYGHWGKPFIVFPCSRGRYFDFEGMGMVAEIAGFIDAGKIKLYCVDSVDSESWYNYAVPPAERNARHEAYDGYMVHEVVPFIRHHCGLPGARAMATGCSMGAYHAVNFFLKHPDLCEGTIALSGLYRLDRHEFDLERRRPAGGLFQLAHILSAETSTTRGFWTGTAGAPSSSAWARAPGRTRPSRTRAAWTALPRKIDPRLGGLLGSGRQPRLALVVQADELLPGQALRLTSRRLIRLRFPTF